MVTVRGALVTPTTCWPKFSEVTLEMSTPLTTTPLPDRGIAVGELLAVLLTVSVVLTVPAVVGKKATLNWTLCPGLIDVIPVPEI
jgi:hypothetical protein